MLSRIIVMRRIRLVVAFVLLGSAYAALASPQGSVYPAINLPSTPTDDDILHWAFAWERETWARISPDDPISPVRLNKAAVPGGEPYWPALVQMDPLSRVLRQMGDLADRIEARGVDVSSERAVLAEYARQMKALLSAPELDVQVADQLFFEARQAKRDLMLRDPDLEPLARILFVKRFPYEPSHNYSDHLDSKFIGGGGICVLDIPRMGDRLDPSQAVVTELFNAGNGIPRDPVVDYDAETIYFAHRPPGGLGTTYWHLMRMNADGSGLEQLTDGPFHDYYPFPLPDGDLSFVTTRIGCRFLCWVPRAFSLYRINPGSGAMQTLSFANLTEWSPSVMRDGRILWTRSEYLDKGANFGHTLWAVRPDGTYPELVYGNNTKNCMLNAHEMPGSNEIVSVMISHFGDFNGPIALINPEEGRYNPDALVNITPDVGYGYDTNWLAFNNRNLSWPDRLCFRDPIPISSDYILVSHSPSGDWGSPSHLFGIYVIDRFGNRELLYLDPRIGSMSPTPLRARPRPPVLGSLLREQVAVAGREPEDLTPGQYIVSDVQAGLGASVPPGTVKYLRICEEVKDMAEVQPDGRLREEFHNFTDFYASPIFTPSSAGGAVDVVGPFGWPPYSAKGVEGLVPVEEDGSARFTVPAGRVFYFQALDANLNEIQRMRSVVQVQPGETRSCIGCHEHRYEAPANKRLLAMDTPPREPEAPPWGRGAFGYEEVVQPVFDLHCVSCHGGMQENAVNLAGTHDAIGVPASYRTLITGGWVHYVSCGWGEAHTKNEPMTFGTLKSRLIQTIEGGHHEVTLSDEEMHAIKCWIDLNCPLWPDYQERGERLASQQGQNTE